MITFFIYVNDIIVIGDDQCEINNLKSFLGKEFKIKDLGHLRYFFGLKLLDPRKVYYYPRSSMFYIFSMTLVWVQTL